MGLLLHLRGRLLLLLMGRLLLLLLGRLLLLLGSLLLLLLMGGWLWLRGSLPKEELVRGEDLIAKSLLLHVPFTTVFTWISRRVHPDGFLATRKLTHPRLGCWMR